MIEKFNNLFSEFSKTLLAEDMRQTVEDSAWHRESNVMCHTQMCINFYKENIAHNRTQRQQLLTLIALMAHDLGKPEAEETLEKKDGSGQYRRYAGHEQISANGFISFWCEHESITKPFMEETSINWSDIQAVKFMIQNHLPYGLVNKQKRENLKLALQEYLQKNEVCFYDMLISDANGRVSDNHEEKLQNVDNWIDEFRTINVKRIKPTDHRGEMVILIGASGSGKSTYCLKQNPVEMDNIISLDNFRLEFTNLHYLGGNFGSIESKARYAYAWNFCNTSSSEFTKFVDARTSEIIDKAHKFAGTVFVDNVNATKKSRAKWVELANHAKLKVSTVEFYIAENEVQSRQFTRQDKQVPAQAARRQYVSLDVPLFGSECESVKIVAPW